VDRGHPQRNGGAWLDPVGAVGAIVFALVMLYAFLAAGDTGDTAAELIAFAKDNPSESWTLQLAGLAAPVLIGALVVSVWGRLRGASDVYRALVLVGGTLFIALFAVAMTIWAAPLLSADELTTAGAEAYLAFDDAGWVLLGTAGVGLGTMIVAASLGALELGLMPAWACWVSLVLGVASLATVVAVGFFGWTLWLLGAGVWLLVTGRRAPAATTADAVA
jgi:hypothetical protein